jgi:Fe-S-cluster formation regulator IscX/YfhJ
MSWNIFKRVAELEQWVKDLRDFNFDNSRWIKRVEEKAQKLENANQLLINSNQALIGRHENIGKRFQNLEHQVYLQSRDPRIAALEQQVKDLTDFNNDHSRWLKRIDSKLFIQAVESKAFSIPVDQAKEARRLYQREWRAKNKLNQDARDRKNAYARAYYARTKGEKK